MGRGWLLQIFWPAQVAPLVLPPLGLVATDAAASGERVGRSVIAVPLSSTGLVGTRRRNVAVYRTNLSLLLSASFVLTISAALGVYSRG